MASEQDFLGQDIRLFYTSRDELKKVLQETQEFLESRFAQSLSVSADFSSMMMENLQLESVWQQVNRLFNGHRTDVSGGSRPCIIIAGQTKSGKSSFINELLGGTFVAQSQSPCTARVTRLTYSDRFYVLVRAKSGQQIGEVKYLEKPPIDEELVKLKDEDRENEVLISSTVEAGIKCDFLQHGIDIIDSPGLNENSSLDSLTLGAIESFLPIIIYVIDSNLGITSAVQKDLQTIQRAASRAEVLYLATKIDVQGNSTPLVGQTVSDVEEEKANQVFNKLQKLGYISTSATRQTCEKFLCVSCWEMRLLRREKKRILKQIRKTQGGSADATLRQQLEEIANSRWVKNFEEVKMRILRFAQDQFKNLIVSAGSSLRGVHCQILTMFMDKAHDIKESNMRKKKALYQIKSLEHQIHDQSKSIVEKHRGEFLNQAKLFFAEKKPFLLNEVRAVKYSESVILENMSSSDIQKKCIEEIHFFINERILITLSEYLKSGVLQTCYQELESLKEKVAEYEKDVEQTPAYQVLKKTLLDGYVLSSRAIVRGSLSCFIRNLGTTLRMLLTNPKVLLFGNEPQDPTWKVFQAKQYLKNIDRAKLVDYLIECISNWFDKRHTDFLNSMRYSEILVERSYRMTDKERKEIIKLSPVVARLHMNAFAIISRYRFRNYRLDFDHCLGSGAQGSVYPVLSETGVPVLAAKRLSASRDTFGEIAAEAYYSSILEHPNLIQVVGAVLKESTKKKDHWSVELYMELMHTDALTAMTQGQLGLRKRLWMGLQLARALEFLHSSQLIHRDVKLANLLVNKDLSVAKLSDFGLLKGQGLVDHTLAGTPIYLSPELIRRQSYNTKTDIFSLGIALWYLVEGSGSRHPDYVGSLHTVEEVLAASEGGTRPNRLPDAPESLWDLMTLCWDETPQARPTAGEVIACLESVINDLPPE